MAISRGAGTEIIRTALFEEVDNTGRILIFGAQHHIYTVLSVVCEARSVTGASDWVRMYLKGYDTVVGETAQDIFIFQEVMANDQTFVWNDKFSFNGHEPTDFTGPMDSIVKQDAIADQGSSVAQKLFIDAQDSGSNFHVMVTFIDQNNA